MAILSGDIDTFDLARLEVLRGPQGALYGGSPLGGVKNYVTNPAHLLVVVAVGALHRLDLAEVLIASNACILGPATAAALAASRGWKSLVGPGIVVGVLGYVIANFIGAAVPAMLG